MSEAISNNAIDKLCESISSAVDFSDISNIAQAQAKISSVINHISDKLKSVINEYNNEYNAEITQSEVCNKIISIVFKQETPKNNKELLSGLAQKELNEAIDYISETIAINVNGKSDAERHSEINDFMSAIHDCIEDADVLWINLKINTAIDNYNYFCGADLSRESVLDKISANSFEKCTQMEAKKAKTGDYQKRTPLKEQLNK